MNDSDCASNKPWQVFGMIGAVMLYLIIGSSSIAENPPAAKAEKKQRNRAKAAVQDAKHRSTGKPAPTRDPSFQQYGIYQKTAPRPQKTERRKTTLPLKPQQGQRIVFIGNTLLDRVQHFGHFEAMLHQSFPQHKLIVRNLAWSADTPDIQPRPDNFADTEQHLTHEKADIVLAAFGFNESFAGEKGIEQFRKTLTEYVAKLQASAFNGKAGPKIVLLSPIANENIAGVAAADHNNQRIASYSKVVQEVAAQLGVGFVDVYQATERSMADPETDLTFNGCHLTEQGYAVFAQTLFEGLFGFAGKPASAELRETVVDKNRQYFRRFRPLNTFYYTGGRSQQYGYLDFLPAMQNFDLMVANREQRIWAIAQGKPVPPRVDDSNLPPLPETKESRGANRWMSADDEKKAFQVDPRFEVNLFAGEEEFPDIAAPIQMRWDNRGRLWVSCSTTYPHVYPGNEPNDKLVILEDTDGDGKADKSTVFADDLHIPLSFEFGDGGVYVSEMPHLTFLKDTDGDGKADSRRILLTGFGTEDSHHSLHDFTRTPDGDLLFRESIFHHSQVETPYGPVRQQNSGWFRYEPRTHRLTSFGTYHSTNPWGVTFDDWGQHLASHPIYAAAFHSLDPPYPQQHARPAGLRAYSGVCGHEFVDFPSFPDELQGHFIKVRYKPTNRVEIHEWNKLDFGYDENYVGDLLFSTNLSFIPVDLRFGPRGALYVCDWYNPIKGHAQYSLRDERRDRHSGRIWRITTKGKDLVKSPRIHGASIPELLKLLKSPQYRYRYWAKSELREREQSEVLDALNKWVAELDPQDERFRHHQLEAVWTYRNIGTVNAELLRELHDCEEPLARAAATQQLRYCHDQIDDAVSLLRTSANDSEASVRMEAVIAASYFGTEEALDAMLDVFKHPLGGHLAYATTCALQSHTLRVHWEYNPSYQVKRLLKQLQVKDEIKEPARSKEEEKFDKQKNLRQVEISCIPEQMRFTKTVFTALVGQPVKVVFTNPDATDHNLVIVKQGALAEVGMAANEMAKDPKFANSDFIPDEKRDLILQNAPLIGPTRKSRIHVMRFNAPTEPGVYPFVCTFPGHWVIMKGDMVVAKDKAGVEEMLAARKPEIVKEWTMKDFEDFSPLEHTEQNVMDGMQAFVKAGCNQCHVVAGHGVKLGPDLTDISKRFKGEKLLRQMLEPSSEINKEYLNSVFLVNGRSISGVVVKENKRTVHVVKNLLMPDAIAKIQKEDIEDRFDSNVSPMPTGLLNVLTKEEIVKLHAFLEAGGYQLPEHLEHKHQGAAGQMKEKAHGSTSGH